MGEIRKTLRRAAYVLNPLTARAVDKQKKNCVLARSLRARFARVCNASRVASALKKESAALVIAAAELTLSTSESRAFAHVLPQLRHDLHECASVALLMRALVSGSGASASVARFARRSAGAQPLSPVGS